MAEAAPPDPSLTNAEQIRGCNTDSPGAGKHPRDMREDARSDAMRALARRRWDKARTAESSDAPDLARDATTDGSSAVDRAVVARLEQAAKKGDVAAARELREWRRLEPAEGAGADALRLAQLITQLSTQQRAALRQWLLDQLREDEVLAETGTWSAGARPQSGTSSPAGSSTSPPFGATSSR